MKSARSHFKGLAHLCVYTKDIEKSIAFYRDCLDFKLTYQKGFKAFLIRGPSGEGIEIFERIQ